MTNKTDMVEIKTALAFAKENYHPELKVYTKQLAVVFDALEAAEVNLAKEKEHSANFEREANLYHGKCEAAETRIAELETQVDNDRIQIQGLCASLDNEQLICRKAESELAKLKGDAVPVGYAFEDDVKLMLKGKMISKMLTVREYQVDGAIPIFTHAQPVPVVVLPISQSFEGDEWYWKDAIIKALRENGITVKTADGEGE